jgi:hypothetical protein
MWKAILGYEGYYEVSSHGEVRSLDRTISQKDRWTGKSYSRVMRGKELALKTDKDGYKLVILSKDGKTRTHKVHRLVLRAFSANPMMKPQVNHINGDKSDNRLSNLEWCTDLENTHHAIKNGLFGGFQCSV